MNMSDKRINGKQLDLELVDDRILSLLDDHNPGEVWRIIEDNLINFEHPLGYELFFLENRLKSIQIKH
jgi:N12 class adenine-specific DNA methylase